jgi:hypothetical protein
LLVLEDLGEHARAGGIGLLQQLRRRRSLRSEESQFVRGNMREHVERVAGVRSCAGTWTCTVALVKLGVMLGATVSGKDCALTTTVLPAAVPVPLLLRPATV